MDERLKAFIGKAREFEKGDWKLTLMPFKGKQIDLFMDMGSNPSGEDIRKLVHEALSKSGYEVSMEDVGEFEVGFLNWVAECVVEINGFRLEK
jgi:hypothetical protein